MKLTGDLKEMGFEQPHADLCVFRELNVGDIVAILVVYVDDLLAQTTTSGRMESLVEELGFRYKVKDLGEASYYMRCHTRNHEKRKLEISQDLRLLTIVDRFGIDKTAMVPSTAGKPLILWEDEPRTPQEE